LALLYLGIGRSLFVGTHPDQELHHHATLQITFSLDRPFEVKVPHATWRRTSGVAIASNEPHQFRAIRDDGVSLHVVPEARYTAHLSEGFLGGEEMRLLDPGLLERYQSFFRDALVERSECSDAFRMGEHLIEDLTGMRGYRGLVDERLLMALDTIEHELPRQISLKSLARQVCLSEDRFLHLFSEQLGLPLRPYVLHQRTMRATAEILEGRSVSQAAVSAGFSDTAHFSRTFLRLTGSHPSLIKQYRGSVEVSTCSSSRCIRPTKVDPKGESCLSCLLNRLHTGPKDPGGTT